LAQQGRPRLRVDRLAARRVADLARDDGLLEQRVEVGHGNRGFDEGITLRRHLLAAFAAKTIYRSPRIATSPRIRGYRAG
jgi:hypothetical protein